MALGALAPEIRDAWRKGKIDQKAAQAFTLSADHAVQVAAFNRIKKNYNRVDDYAVRHELANDQPKAGDVGDELLAAYAAAGGTISESLFEEERYIDDGALLRKVRNDAREPLRQKWLADGWAWVKFEDEFQNGERWDYREMEPDVAYTKEETGRLAAIQAMRWQDKTDEHHAEVERIDRDAELRAYTPDMRAKCGVIIDDENDEAAIGLVKRDGRMPEAYDEDEGDEDDAGDAPEADDEIDPDTGEILDDEVDDAPKLSAALIETVTTTLTLAVQRALPADPWLALRMLVATLSGGAAHGMPIKVRLDGYAPAARSVMSFDDAFDAACELDEADLVELLAQELTRAVDMRSYNSQAHCREHHRLRDALPAVEYLAAARELFNAVDYFNRVPKALAESALAEMGVAIASGGKKAELAAMAAREAKDRGWLPVELRHPAFELVDPSAAETPAKKTKRAKS
jgi:ParB family chromosome partitioning protein